MLQLAFVHLPGPQVGLWLGTPSCKTLFLGVLGPLPGSGLVSNFPQVIYLPVPLCRSMTPNLHGTSGLPAMEPREPFRRDPSLRKSRSPQAERAEVLGQRQGQGPELADARAPRGELHLETGQPQAGAPAFNASKASDGGEEASPVTLTRIWPSFERGPPNTPGISVLMDESSTFWAQSEFALSGVTFRGDIYGAYIVANSLPMTMT